MTERTSPLLAESPQGRAFYCACKDRVSLLFKERWFGFEPGDLPAFRSGLAKLLQDRPLVLRLLAEAEATARREGMSQAVVPSLSDLMEMLDLVDATLLVLEAQATLTNPD